MSILVEGDIQFNCSAAENARRFDDSSTHGLSHCMKAIDFIVELQDKILFVEVKDPEHPQSRQEERTKFVQKMQSGELRNDLKTKYRDSFLYEWASDKIPSDKKIVFIVLLAIDALTPSELIAKTDDLKRHLPVDGPSGGDWIKQIVHGCIVLNIKKWKMTFPNLPISRLSDGLVTVFDLLE